MIKIPKAIITKSIIAGLFSTVTIGALTLLTYQTTLGLFLAASFGSSMVVLFGFPESPFAQPKNVFFWTFVNSIGGSSFCKIYSFTNLYHYCSCSRLRSFFNDPFECGAPACRWKPNCHDCRRSVL